MLKRDSLWIGLVAGLILPGIATGVIELLQKELRFFRRTDLLYIACIALNLLLVKYLFKKGNENSARGVVGATFICAIVFFYYKSRIH